jgi:hypothetical protein
LCFFLTLYSLDLTNCQKIASLNSLVGHNFHCYYAHCSLHCCSYNWSCYLFVIHDQSVEWLEVSGCICGRYGLNAWCALYFDYDHGIQHGVKRPTMPLHLMR